MSKSAISAALLLTAAILVRRFLRRPYELAAAEFIPRLADRTTG
jgi:hypothetical protein